MPTVAVFPTPYPEGEEEEANAAKPPCAWEHVRLPCDGSLYDGTVVLCDIVPWLEVSMRCPDETHCAGLGNFVVLACGGSDEAPDRNRSGAHITFSQRSSNVVYGYRTVRVHESLADTDVGIKFGF